MGTPATRYAAKPLLIERPPCAKGAVTSEQAPHPFVVARLARSGFAASGKPRIARGSSSPQKAGLPFGDPKGSARARPFRCSSFSHRKRFAGLRWEPKQAGGWGIVTSLEVTATLVTTPPSAASGAHLPLHGGGCQSGNAALPHSLLIGALTRHACRVGRGGAAGCSRSAACGESRPSPACDDDARGRLSKRMSRTSDGRPGHLFYSALGLPPPSLLGRRLWGRRRL